MYGFRGAMDGKERRYTGCMGFVVPWPFQGISAPMHVDGKERRYSERTIISTLLTKSTLQVGSITTHDVVSD